MKKILLTLGLLITPSLHAGTRIVALYLENRNMQQVRNVLAAQPQFAFELLDGRRTPLHELAGHTSVSTVLMPFEVCQLASALLNAGAYPNAQDCEGNTALHIVARADNYAFASMLRERGARRDIPNAAGNTPVEVAQAQRGRQTPMIVGLENEFEKVRQRLLAPSPVQKVQG